MIDLDGLAQILWPVHCVEGTPGAEFVDTLDTARIDSVFQKGSDPTVDSYSGFFDNDHRRATGLNEFLHERGVTEVYVLGLATDYCVMFTALDARELGYETFLIEDGCRGVDLKPGDVDRAVEAMREAGVKMVQSVDVKREEAL